MCGDPVLVSWVPVPPSIRAFAAPLATGCEQLLRARACRVRAVGDAAYGRPPPTRIRDHSVALRGRRHGTPMLTWCRRAPARPTVHITGRRVHAQAGGEREAHPR